MKFLTKEWYNLSQQTGLHYSLRVHKGAYQHDEALYERLYKRKEREYVKFQRELYNLDPRSLLDDMKLIPLEKVLSEEEVTEDDFIVMQISDEQRVNIEKQIAEYDVRPPFNEQHFKQEFSSNLEWNRQVAAAKLPKELFSQIADIRVYTLGYCTKEIFAQLKKLSKDNENKVRAISAAAAKVQKEQHIPESIYSKFNFHDCTVTALDLSDELVIRLDPRGGFTKYNKITFTTPQIVMQEVGIVGSSWIYDEIYKTDQGYEVHALLWSGKGLCELIVGCEDIVVEEEHSG